MSVWEQDLWDQFPVRLSCDLCKFCVKIWGVNHCQSLGMTFWRKKIHHNQLYFFLFWTPSNNMKPDTRVPRSLPNTTFGSLPNTTISGHFQTPFEGLPNTRLGFWGLGQGNLGFRGGAWRLPQHHSRLTSKHTFRVLGLGQGNLGFRGGAWRLP